MKVPFPRRFSLIVLVFGTTLPIASDPLIAMQRVGGGTFEMGSDQSDNPEVRPRHRVTVSTFWIGKTEVTQSEWKRVMATDRGSVSGDDLPVDQVSWREACAFCNGLSERDGRRPAYRFEGDDVIWDRSANGYRLPTEAEWEFAARGGTASHHYRYSGSNDADEVAWWSQNSGSGVHPVAQKKPNELGLYDMSGNAWEWCWDWYGSYSDKDQSDPQGPDQGDRHPAQGASPATGPIRVSRGGGWTSSRETLAANERFFSPDYRGWVNGFRVARSD